MLSRPAGTIEFGGFSVVFMAVTQRLDIVFLASDASISRALGFLALCVVSSVVVRKFAQTLLQSWDGLPLFKRVSDRSSS